jgi:hypothetical protein
MFRVVVYDTNECKYIYKGKLHYTYEQANIDDSAVSYYYSIKGENLELSIQEVSDVTYASLIHSLSEYNDEICPIYTIRNMNVDECFHHLEIDLQGEKWDDYARIEIYNMVMAEIEQMKIEA